MAKWISGANVNASDNGGVGIVVGSGQFAIFGFAVSAGSTRHASGKGLAGIFVGAPLFAIYPPSAPSGNGVFGVRLAGPPSSRLFADAARRSLAKTTGWASTWAREPGVILQGG
jgi:hypothetical protein